MMRTTKVVLASVRRGGQIQSRAPPWPAAARRGRRRAARRACAAAPFSVPSAPAIVSAATTTSAEPRRGAMMAGEAPGQLAPSQPRSTPASAPGVEGGPTGAAPRRHCDDSAAAPTPRLGEGGRAGAPSQRVNVLPRVRSNAPLARSRALAPAAAAPLRLQYNHESRTLTSVLRQPPRAATHWHACEWPRGDARRGGGVSMGRQQPRCPSRSANYLARDSIVVGPADRRRGTAWHRFPRKPSRKARATSRLRILAVSLRLRPSKSRHVSAASSAICAARGRVITVRMYCTRAGRGGIEQHARGVGRPRVACGVRVRVCAWGACSCQRRGAVGARCPHGARSVPATRARRSVPRRATARPAGGRACWESAAPVRERHSAVPPGDDSAAHTRTHTTRTHTKLDIDWPRVATPPTVDALPVLQCQWALTSRRCPPWRRPR